MGDQRDDVKTIRVTRCRECYAIIGLAAPLPAGAKVPVFGHSPWCEDATTADLRRHIESLRAKITFGTRLRDRHVVERQRWEGKYRIVCHENNRLRAKVKRLEEDRK